MRMTKKDLLELLEPYNDNTIIITNCSYCNHGESGGDIIQIRDNTNQTFGYIEVVINRTWDEMEKGEL